MVFNPPFHDRSRESTFDAMVARLRSVVGDAGHVEVPMTSVRGEVLVWSRHERPVAFVTLNYDTPKREIDDGLLSVNGGVVQLWYPTDDDWRLLFPDLHLQPGSVVSFEAFGHGGSCSDWLLSHPLVERIFATAATKQAALAYRWTGEAEDEILGANS